jgi:hypothetical protein
MSLAIGLLMILTGSQSWRSDFSCSTPGFPCSMP